MPGFYLSFAENGKARCEIAEGFLRIEMQSRRRCEREHDQTRQVVFGQIALELQRERFSHIQKCVVCLVAEQKAEAKEAA
jgi:hypothetical protein